MKRFIILLLFILVYSCDHTACANVSVAVMQQAAAVVTGNQDFTVSGFGTPKAVIGFMSGSITNGTARDHALFAIGLTDCTNQFSVHIQSRDAQATTDAARRTTNALFLELYQTDGQTVDGAGSVTCITDGIRINWTTALSQAYLIELVFFTGSDLTAAVGTFNINATQDATTAVTSPGFTPDDVFFVSYDSSTASNNNVVSAKYSLGIAHRIGGTVQRHVFWTDTDGVTTTSVGSGVHDSYMWGAGSATSWPNDMGELTSWDANGFTITTRLAASTACLVRFLALKYNGAVGSWVSATQTPTSTGNVSNTSVGFQPQFLMSVMTGAAALNTVESDDDAGTFGISINTATSQYCAGVRSDDALASDSDTSSVSNNKSVYLQNATGGVRWEATLVSFNSNGWTRNYSTTQGTGHYAMHWAIEVSAVAGTARRVRTQIYQ